MSRLMWLAAVASLTAAAATAADGKTFVLTVSVSRAEAIPTFRPLPQADAAASKLHDAFKREMSQEGCVGYRLGLDRAERNHPTLANIRDRLDLIAEEAGPDDRVLVTVVTHGFENQDGAALLAYDSRPSDPASMLAVRELVARVARMRAKDKAVFIDACRDIRDDLAVTVPAEFKAKPEPDLDALERFDLGLDKKAEQSLFVVQSCGIGRYAFEKPGGAGLMTEALIEALAKDDNKADADGNKTVTIAEAVEYARGQVRKQARNLHREHQVLDDRKTGEPFLLAKVNSTAPSKGPGTDASNQVQAPTLGYQSQTIPFGVSPAQYASTSGTQHSPTPWGQTAFSDRPVVNLMVGNGIPQDSRAGTALDLARPFVPAQAQRYLPQTGVPLGPQIAGWIGR